MADEDNKTKQGSVVRQPQRPSGVGGGFNVVQMRASGPSKRQKRMAAKAVPMATEYVIVDDRIMPDMMGQLGGARIYQRGKQRLVKMTPGQAQWYLEHLAIRRLTS